MTSVTLKIKSRSSGLNWLFILPWCFCAPNLVRIHRVLLQILSGNHLCYAEGLYDLSDLENKVKVTRFELGLCPALVLLCTKFGEDTSSLSSDTQWKPSFLCKITWTLVFILPWCFCVPNLVRICQIFLQILEIYEPFSIRLPIHNTSRFSNGRIKITLHQIGIIWLQFSIFTYN